MGQLVQLQKKYAEFQRRHVEVVVVFREEQDGLEGLRRTQKSTGAKFPLLLDPDAQHTASYSAEGFSTYLIDRNRKVRAELTGSKVVRPTADAILKRCDELGLK